jgi:hypothetical protein
VATEERFFQPLDPERDIPPAFSEDPLFMDGSLRGQAGSG